MTDVILISVHLVKKLVLTVLFVLLVSSCITDFVKKNVLMDNMPIKKPKLVNLVFLDVNLVQDLKKLTVTNVSEI